MFFVLPPQSFRTTESGTACFLPVAMPPERIWAPPKRMRLQYRSKPGDSRLRRADVAELADAHGLGPCARKGVGVQVPSSAPGIVSRFSSPVSRFAAAPIEWIFSPVPRI